MTEREGSIWVWNFRWRRLIFVWEVDLLIELLGVATRQTRVDREDFWFSLPNPDGRFSVKSACSLLFKGLPDASAPQGDTLRAVASISKSWAPSKVIVFSWQLLLDRIPTRSNLVRCGVPLLVTDLGCVSCDVLSESAVHLFLECPTVFPVWYQVARWLGWEFVFPLGLAQQFQAFTGFGRGKRVRLGLLLVWHAVI